MATSNFMKIANANTEELFASLDQTTSELVELISSFTDGQINQVPFVGSWTAAQLVDHVTKSNIGIIRSLKKEGSRSGRDPQRGIQQMRDVFLDFETKLQSPDFILPAQDIYQRELVIDNLQKSIDRLRETAADAELFQTIHHPIFGEVTKLELTYFVVYHTQRHLHQLKNIFIITKTRGKSKMRNLVAFMHISLDGFVASERGEMDWITIDEEIFKDAILLADNADTALFGRITYQMMESYWPTVLANDASTEAELRHAKWMENINKVVFSETLEKVAWNNTTLVKQNIPDEILKLKEKAGKNMMIFGSPRLTHSLMQWDLIDEYRINVNPVILGRGIPLFDLHKKIGLKLIALKNFQSGVVGLHYKRSNQSFSR